MGLKFGFAGMELGTELLLLCFSCSVSKTESIHCLMSTKGEYNIAIGAGELVEIMGVCAAFGDL